MGFSGSRRSIISIFLFHVLIPYTVSLTFNLTKISPRDQNRDIVTEGDGAYISDGGIQVTPDGIGSNRNLRAGRASYITLLHLWDNASSELANFTTDFSFVIDSNSATSYADGLTFFLAENNSVITAGGSMGLPVNDTTNVMTNRFVAVEFDTYFNPDWDPRDSTSTYIGDHVGINVNSLTSVRYKKWFSNVTGGRECHAWIKYDSVSKNLSVAFTGFEDDVVVRQHGLDYTIDLRGVLPEWVIFGFSAATGDLFQKNNVKSWNFKSSDLKIDEKEEFPPTFKLIPKEGKRRKQDMVGLIVVLCVLVTFLALLALLVWRKKKNKRRGDAVDELGLDVQMNNQIEMVIWPKKFSYQDIAKATTNFKEKLGEGGFGGVYKGFLEDSKTDIAVKRVSKNSMQGFNEYASEVTIISGVRHRNLVQLLGWCHEKEELLLVYEYLENRSLDLHLFEAKNLTWGTRYEISKGLASSLLYLHEECVKCVLHRDIKSSNVMLDSNFNAKLGDFGLAKFVDHEKGSQTTMFGGTKGYMAPEYVVSGKPSKKSDVFSFGVVALEIACGRKIVDNKVEENKRNLVEWVWRLYGDGTLLKATDPHLGSNFVEEEIECLMMVGLWCANPEPKDRPYMTEVIQVLKLNAPLPKIPLKMPVVTHFVAPMFSSDDSTSISQIQSSSNSCNTDSSMHTASSSTSSSSPYVSLLHSIS